MRDTNKSSKHVFSAVAILSSLVSACSGSGIDDAESIANQMQSPSQPFTSMVADDQATPVDNPVETTSEPIIDLAELPTESEESSIIDVDATPVANEADESATILRADNANAVIDQAFEVFTGRAYDRRLTAYPYVEQAPSLTPQFNALGEHFYYDTLACSNNGEKFENLNDPTTANGSLTVYDTTYANCSINGDVLSGRAILSGDTCCNSGYQKEFSNNFSLFFGDDGEMRLSGIYKNAHQISVENFNYELSFSGGALSVTNATTVKTDKELSGSFQMTPPIINNLPVTVTVSETFENEEGQLSNLSYARGVMQIQASDSEIILNANNSEDDTVLVTVNAGGETITRTEPWSKWFHALSFVPPILGQDILGESLDGDGTVINRDTYSNVLTEVFNVITGERFGEEVNDFPLYSFPSFPTAEMREVTGFGDVRDGTCDNSGSAALRPFRWGVNQITQGWRSEFENCSRDGRTFTGSFSTRRFGNSVNFSQGLTVATNNQSITFEGTMNYKRNANRGDSSFPLFFYQLKNAHFSSTELDDAFVLSEASFSYRAQDRFPQEMETEDASYSQMQGSFLLSSDATGQNTIRVNIPDVLIFSHLQQTRDVASATSDAGVLHIDAGNGNELYLYASTGDVDTFRVFVYQPGQDPFVAVERWQDWEHLFGFNFDLVVNDNL